MATTTTPNKLTQVHQYVWYGTCESDLCDDEIFDEWGTKLYDINQNVIEISTYEDGILKTFRPDGKYGSKTEQAVRKFQSDAGIKVDGLFGPESLKALNQYNMDIDDTKSGKDIPDATKIDNTDNLA